MPIHFGTDGWRAVISDTFTYDNLRIVAQAIADAVASEHWDKQSTPQSGSVDQPTEQLFPWSPRRLEYLLEDISNEAGLTKHLSFDMCRWTCALTDYRAGEDPDKIRQKLGVSKIQWRELFIKLKQLAGSKE